MRLLDILLLILLSWGGYRGFNKGLIGEIFSIGALVLAVLGSMRLLGSVIALYTQWFHGQDELPSYVVFVCLFVIILIAVTVAGRLLKAFIKLTILGSLDKLLGSILGILKWCIGISTLLWLGSLIQLKIPETYTKDTFLFPIIESISPKLLAYCSSWMPYLQEQFTTTDTLQDQ